MNFKHLYYFWAAANAGGVMRAGEQLHTTPQTLSGADQAARGSGSAAASSQERAPPRADRGGRAALKYADQIFALGEELEAAMGKARGGAQALDFRVGLADAVPKAIAYRLLEPALGVPGRSG